MSFDKNAIEDLVAKRNGKLKKFMATGSLTSFV